MAKDAIPDGGGFEDGVRFLSSKTSIIDGFRKASAWTQAAIKAVRDAAEPNRFKNSSDEEIATEIIRKIEEKTQCQKHKAITRS